ncbi:MAG: hypothetical protein JSV86_08745 [Gemmatimonadota bacterium]|nr:MAG: hypothetical protein JSV86_08745 [Gemmatimonadota bacterium]
MPAQIQLPDSRARRTAVLLVLAIAFTGAVAAVATNRYVEDLREMAREDPDLAIYQAVLAIRLLAVTIGVLLVGFAAWLSHLSLRSYRAACFPPPGTRLIRERTVATGDAARRQARLGFALAALFAVAAVGLTAFLWHFPTLLARV